MVVMNNSRGPAFYRLASVWSNVGLAPNSCQFIIRELLLSAGTADGRIFLSFWP